MNLMYEDCVFDLLKLFKDVFHPEAGEWVVVVLDLPNGNIVDNPLWKERRSMAAEWHALLDESASELGVRVAPLVSFPAVGTHNGYLPLGEGEPVVLSEALGEATIGLANSTRGGLGEGTHRFQVRNASRCGETDGKDCACR